MLNYYVCIILIFSICSAAAFPIDSIATLFKIFIILFSILVILNVFFIKKTFKIKKNILLFFLYLCTLLFFYDNNIYSQKIIFNNFSILCSGIIAQYLCFFEKKYVFFYFLFLTIFILLRIFLFQYVDKLQVHTQIWNIIFFMIILNGLKIKNFMFMFFLSMVTSIRSSLFGLTYIFIFQKIKKFYFHLLMIITIIFLFVNIYSLFQDNPNLGIGSFKWRLIHWNNLLKDYDCLDFLFGKGLGYSLNITPQLSDFYTMGQVIDTHSHYIKILADTGVIGILLYLFVLNIIYNDKKNNIELKYLILYYITYGLLDSGIWQFSLFWFILLAEDDKIIYTIKV